MTTEEREALAGRVVVLFDGECGLCHGVVRFARRRDRGGRMRFVAQESELGRELMEGLVAVEGVVVREGERVWVRSDAVSRMLRVLGGVWGVLGWGLGLVPRGVREWGYGLVARWRYRVFGRVGVCPVPAGEERGRVVG